jgi:cytidylate kinase
MQVITISRQLGSLGQSIGRICARELGYRFVYREAINQAALRCGAPEMALAVIDDLGLLDVKPSRQARKAYQTAVAQVMRELAEDGRVVIVGRAGQVILHARADTLHVRIVAPVALRAERIAAARSISIEAAREQIAASDRARRDYLLYNYHARWNDPDWYDLIINTAGYSSADAAALICTAATRSSLPAEKQDPMDADVD